VPPGHDLDDVKAGLIRGQSLEQVLGEIKTTKPKSSLPEIPVIADPKTDERVRVLDGMVKRLRNYVQELQEGLREKDHEIVKLQSRIRKIRSIGQAEVQKDAEVLKRDTVIRSLKKRLHREERSNRNLRKRIERQKTIEEITISGDSVPVRILPALTKDAIRTLSEDPGISAGDMLYLIRTDGWGGSSIRELRELRVGAVISGPGNPSQRDPQLYRACLEHCIPLLNGLDIPVLIRGRIGIAKKDTLDSCLLQWNKAYHDFEIEKNAQQIEDLLKHYQTERGKEMKKIG
jgi:predicted RNase H-like nuclease (RuvC/YqgF family)